MKKADKLEISSSDLRSELIEIKERVGALETIASLANRPVVEAYVRSSISSDTAKRIMALCEQAKTKADLRSELGLASDQAIDFHLKPLRQDDLLQPQFNKDGKMTFGWSNLFRRLPAKTIAAILGPAHVIHKRRV